MRIAVLGTGYVGLVSGTCFADSGNDVVCVDVDAAKINRLREGQIPIYEPGLTELVIRNHDDGRLQFTTDLAAAVAPADLVFLAVGTPSGHDGAADESYLWKAVEQAAPHLAPEAIFVVKSTVPVGTNTRILKRLRELTGRDCLVCSNPEFLKEGAAIEDFTRPDRVVVGVREAKVGERLRDLYAPFLRTGKPFVVMSPESAEMTKYVANALLSTKISFINEIANVCERTGADINDVRQGIGHDSRIGFAFLFPGVGYGGSCFPKDVRALSHTARQVGVVPRMLDAVDATNEAQKTVIGEILREHFGDSLTGRVIAIWGLAFKPRTDDIREAPALSLIDEILAKGGRVRVHDPEASENVERHYRERRDRVTLLETQYETLDGADALCIMTEWKQFMQPDFNQIRRRLKSPVIFDGRNLYSPAQLASLGFTYHSIGRATTRPAG